MSALRAVKNAPSADEGRRKRPPPKPGTVAHFLTKKIDELVDSKIKDQIQIAEEAGWQQPNMIAMLKSGVSKLPVNKVGALAKAIDVDPGHLFRLVMREYSPETMSVIEEIYGREPISENELEIVHLIRKANPTDPSVETDDQRQALLAWAKGLSPKAKKVVDTTKKKR